jgi:hypothetical protein
MTRNDQLDAVDLHTKKLKSCSKVKLFIRGGFQQLDVPNFYSSNQYSTQRMGHFYTMLRILVL